MHVYRQSSICNVESFSVHHLAYEAHFATAMLLCKMAEKEVVDNHLGLPLSKSLAFLSLD